MPLPGYKNEVKAKLYIDGNNGYGAKASYAIDSHIVMMGGGGMLKYNHDRPFEILSLQYIDGGGGYYSRFGKYGRFDATLSAGYSSINSATRNSISRIGFTRKGPLSDTVENLNIISNNYRLAAQADIAMHLEGFELGFGLRLSELLPNGNYTATYADTSRLIARSLTMPLKQSILFIEPGIQLSAGIKNVKLSAQVGISCQLSGLKVPEFYSPIYLPYFADLGLVINIFNGPY